MSTQLRCSSCKHPLEVGEITVVTVLPDSTELAFDCEHCDESFHVWVEHKHGWANSVSEPVDLRVATVGQPTS